MGNQYFTKLLVIALFCFSQTIFFAQNSCSPGDPNGDPGGGVPPPGTGWDFPVVQSYDPNDIVPPEAVGTEGWVRRDVLLPFMLRCENHPDSATAPVQEAWFYLPFHPNVDASRFQFGDIGFGDFYISVPPGLQSYSSVVDASATLGVKVQITAGIQASPHRAYWHFVSLDPATNQPVTDPFLGFLPVNDTITHKGEGFAHFSLTPKPTTQTGDIIETQASIIFDQNLPIATPTLVNTIDADHPVSRIDTSFSAPDNRHLRVKWSGTDVGCGIANYTIFVSVNDSTFVPWRVLTDSMEALLPAVIGNHYRFISVARDSVGNVEPVGAPVEVTFTEDLIITDVKEPPLSVAGLQVQVYPNPNSGSFFVEILGLEGQPVTLRLLDVIGRVVAVQKFADRWGDVVLPFRNLEQAAGVYLLEVRSGEKAGIVRVLKQ